MLCSCVNFLRLQNVIVFPCFVTMQVLFLYVDKAISSKDADKMSSYEITYPEQYEDYDHTMKKTDICTKMKYKDGMHNHYAYFSITFEEKTYNLDLQLNNGLLRSNFGVTTFTDLGELREAEPSMQEVELCYYKGTVRGIEGSKVRASTCKGLKGVIDIPNDHFMIAPILPDGDTNSKMIAHMVYRPHRNNTGYGNDTMGSVVYALARSSDVTDRAENVNYRNVGSDKKFLELMIVADYALCKRFGDADLLINYIKEVVNYVDSFFEELDVRVVLDHVELWKNEDRATITSNAFTTLSNFAKYRRERFLHDSRSSAWVNSDVVQLLSGVNFAGKTIGVSTVGRVCGAGAVGLNKDLSGAFYTSSTIAHELGHNFGMRHDSSECVCPRGVECIMAKSARFTNTLGWSSCSKQFMKTVFHDGFGSCLNNVPQSIVGNPTCRNDIVEFGEQCDCGLPKSCKSSCCDPLHCMFREDIECDIGECCENCRYLKRGVTCREKQSECDLEEYCNGVSPYCPPDTYKEDGSSCRDEESFCKSGICVTHDLLCQGIWGSGAVSASNECYNQINAFGNEIGNCGMSIEGDYIPCQKEDVQCGKLLCTGGRDEPGNGLISQVRNLEVDHVKFTCKAILPAYSNSDNKNVGMVLSGTSCDKEKICSNGSCVLAARTCSSKCHGNGVCNNFGHCHCNAGFAPPFCNESGEGGSVENGLHGTENSTLNYTDGQTYRRAESWTPNKSIYYGPVSTPYLEREQPIIAVQYILALSAGLVIFLLLIPGVMVYYKTAQEENERVRRQSLVPRDKTKSDRKESLRKEVEEHTATESQFSVNVSSANPSSIYTTT